MSESRGFSVIKRPLYLLITLSLNAAQVHAQSGNYTPGIASPSYTLPPAPSVSPLFPPVYTPLATPSVPALPPAPVPSLQSTPATPSAPPPLPPLPTLSCDTIEGIAYDAYANCNIMKQECDRASAARDALCTGVPSVEDCESSEDPNCDICKSAEYNAYMICTSATNARLEYSLHLQDFLPEYIQQGCMGCYLDVVGINTYDVCIRNSPRASSQDCP